MLTIYRSFLLKSYYGNIGFYKNVKDIINSKDYNTKTLHGAINIMWECGTYNLLNQ